MKSEFLSRQPITELDASELEAVRGGTVPVLNPVHDRLQDFQWPSGLAHFHAIHAFQERSLTPPPQLLLPAEHGLAQVALDPEFSLVIDPNPMLV